MDWADTLQAFERIFPPRTPKRILDAAARKFAYIVLKDRKPMEDGGVLRGYQLTDRLFVGSIKKAQAAADEARAKAATLERARQEKAERRAKVEEGQRLAGRDVPEGEVRPRPPQPRHAAGLRT